MVLVEAFTTNTSNAPIVIPRVRVMVSLPGSCVSKFKKCLDANASEVGRTATLKVAAVFT
jgi:hypothetical protein